MTKLAGNTPVPFWKLFKRMGGFWTLIPLVVTLLLTIMSNSEENTARLFATEGIATTAQVQDKYYTRDTDSDGDVDVTYYLALSFTTHAERRMEIVTSVNQARYNRTDPGTTIPLWYLESTPDRVQLSQTEHADISNVLRWIALGFGLVTLAGIWFTARWAVAAVRARRYGARETAEVTGLINTGTEVNDRPMYRLGWREQSGREGRSLMNRESELQPYARPGTQIIVYQGIKRAFWTGDIGERKGFADAEDRG